MELELIDGNPVVSHVVRFKDRTTISERDAEAVRDGAVIVWVVRTLCQPPSYHPVKKDSDERYRFNIQDVQAAAVLHGELRDGALAYIDDPTQTQGRFVFEAPTYNGDTLVEIGGQTMTQAQYDAARAPLLDDNPPAIDPTVFAETATVFPPTRFESFDEDDNRVSIYGPAGSDAQRFIERWDEL